MKIKLSTIIKFLLLLNITAVCSFGGILLYYYIQFISTVPVPRYEELMPKEYTSSIYNAKTGALMKSLEGEIEREYVYLSEIPDNVVNAVIAIEDKRFYEHKGVDLKATVRALVRNIQNNGVTEGGSTITQQLVKLNVLNDSSVKMERKLKEQYLAYQIEKNINDELGEGASKAYVMEAYLNSIALGHGMYGLGAAASFYFDKDVAELTLAEASILAATIKNPTRFSPYAHYDDNDSRRKIVLYNMLDQELITYNQYKEAVSADLSETIRANVDRKSFKTSNTYYIDQLIEQVLEHLMEQKEMNREEAYKLIYGGGLTIYCAMDPHVQNILDTAYGDDSNFPRGPYDVVYTVTAKNGEGSEETLEFTSTENSPENAELFGLRKKETLQESGYAIISDKLNYTVQPQSAMVIIDYPNNEVAGIVGGRGEKEGNLTFNRSVHAKRQPGSVFKVLAAYAPALDTGVISPSTTLIDAPYKSGNYQPKNWNGRYLGAVSVRSAIQNSMNVLAVKTLDATGYDIAFDYLENFGFTSLVDEKEVNGKVYTDKGPALALGGITDGVSLLELTQAYAVIANDGLYNTPYFYTKVLDMDGNILLEKKQENRQVIETDTARILTSMLQSVITSGTGKAASFRSVSMPVAGKTGTTSNTKDLLFVGYTPYYCGGIWLGYDMPKTLSADGSHIRLWRSIMEQVHTGLPYERFPESNFKEATIKSLPESSIILPSVEIITEEEPEVLTDQETTSDITAESTVAAETEQEQLTEPVTERITEPPTESQPEPQTVYRPEETTAAIVTEPPTEATTQAPKPTRDGAPSFDEPIS